MRPRPHRRAAQTIGAALAIGGAAAVPATAIAQSASPAPATTLSVRATHNVLLGHRVAVNGHDGTGQAGHAVDIEVRGANGWSSVATAQTRAGGRFRVSWRPPHLGRFALRAIEIGVGPLVAASASTPSKVTVYRSVEVSWYGPGLYGSPLACGGTLEPGELGVANKTLPCGTRVTLRYGSRRVTVPVIDRGPYVAGREYDLTAATRDRLSAPSTGEVWSSR